MLAGIGDDHREGHRSATAARRKPRYRFGWIVDRLGSGCGQSFVLGVVDFDHPVHPHEFKQKANPLR